MSEVERWVKHVAAHTRPERVEWWDGSDAALQGLEQELEATGQLHHLDHARSYLWRHRVRPGAAAAVRVLLSDVGRAPIDPRNEVVPRAEATRSLWPAMRDSMRGRPMYAIPYTLGPEQAPTAGVGLQLTDSPQLVLLMHRLFRTGTAARERCRNTRAFVRSLHCARAGDADLGAACIFMESRTIWAAGLEADDLLALRNHDLRLASAEGHRDGWLASPMSIMAITPPSGQKVHLGALFAPGCGQTHFASLSGRAGWRVEMVSDGGAWLRADGDGNLRALPIRCGVLASLQRLTSRLSPQLFAAARYSGLFVNAALRDDRAPFWDALDLERDPVVFDWEGQRWDPAGPSPAAHPAGRVAFANGELPCRPGSFDNDGLRLNAIVFGVRRSDTVPLVVEAAGWENGAYMGAMLGSSGPDSGSHEPTIDPFAMRQLSAIDLNEYAADWLALGRQLRPPPKVFQVNWYRRDASGTPLWPGFAENARVLEWIVNRLRGQATARATIAGFVPKTMDFDASGLALEPSRLDELLAIDPGEWSAEVARHANHIGANARRGYPFELKREHARLGAVLGELATRAHPGALP